MKFRDTAYDREKRLSVGLEEESGRYYLSIPVSNGLVDYEEYYVISKQQHDGYPANQTELSAFADECRKRQHDDLLIVLPGKDRGAS